jgi:signal transduction histidine kinase
MIRQIVFIIICIGFFTNAKSNVLTPKSKSILVSGLNNECFVDAKGVTTIDFILKNPQVFNQNKSSYFENPNANFWYWYKIELENESDNIMWYLVSHNYIILELELYVPDQNGTYQKTRLEKNTSIYDRKIQHKQPVFELILPKGSKKTIYLRLKNNYSFKYTFELYSSNFFLTKYFAEYQWFGIFYGMLVFVVLYGILMYLSLNENTQLCYLIFMASQILFMIFRDGTIVFLIGGLSEYSISAKNFSMAFFSISLAMFSIMFFKIKNPSLLVFISVVLAIRFLIFLLFANDFALWLYHFDMAILTICFGGSLYSLKTDFDKSKFFVAGLFCLWATYFIYYLSINNILSLGGFSFFGLYYGIVAEAIFFTFSISYDVKNLSLEKDKQEGINNLLEKMVQERTSVINQQNIDLEHRAEELNQFLYKSSHDIKGPIKTIEGLCMVAKIDYPQNQLMYIDKILDRVKSLDILMKDLQDVTLTKNIETKIEMVDFDLIHQEIDSIFEEFPGKKEVEVHFKHNKQTFYTDVKIVSTIYQNLFENAIKYRNRFKEPQILDISIEYIEQNCVITFKDNGLGIPEKSQPKIFDMFYKANAKHADGTGLGLYLVKISVDKLGGTIKLNSKELEGSTFEVTLPNMNVQMAIS